MFCNLAMCCVVGLRCTLTACDSVTRAEQHMFRCCIASVHGAHHVRTAPRDVLHCADPIPNASSDDPAGSTCVFPKVLTWPAGAKLPRLCAPCPHPFAAEDRHCDNVHILVLLQRGDASEAHNHEFFADLRQDHEGFPHTGHTLESRMPPTTP